MDVIRAGEGEFEAGDAHRFTGEVWLRRTVEAPERTNVAIVCFAPGSRTHWHRHPGGQFLYGVEGRGRVRSRGERGIVLGPGDVAYVSPDEWHFHGGAPQAPLVHVAVNGGGAPEWGDPVTDEEYAEGF
jgi:quercetin dioxygenase-like cupin family protein